MPISFSPDFVVNSTTHSEQYRPSITTLADGRFVASWYSYDGATGFDIRARIYAADGTPTGPDFTVNSTTANSQEKSSITALADGRFVVVWSSDEGAATDNDIRARVYNADGTAQGQDFVVNSTTANAQLNPALTALADGRFVVTWYSDEGAATGNDIRARIFDGSGTPTAADFVVNSTTANGQSRPDITALADGRFVATWYSYEGTATGNDIRARIFAVDGTATGQDFVVNSTKTSGQFRPDITTLADGRVVVAWYSKEGTATGFDIRARVFGTDGKAEGQDFVVNSTAAEAQYNPSITALTDGRFVVTWYSDEGSATGNDIRARVYGADGTAAGLDFVINSTAGSDQSRPSVSALADGRFVVVWQSDEGTATSADIRATILDPYIFNGTADPDKWIGGPGADTMFGYTNNDVFIGGRGDDFLSGGRGRDTLRGGDGTDTLRGGAGDDRLHGGQGSDSLTGGRGADKFIYLNDNEAGDAIAKFAGRDKFVFEGSAFGLGSYTGRLSEANFRSGSTNDAKDENDHFIYRTTDSSLWFDPDGKGGSDPIKIADIDNAAVLHARDILII